MASLTISLAPYLGELDLGVLKIPKISSHQASLFKRLGPILLIVTLICSVPILPSQIFHTKACGNKSFSIDFIVEDDVDTSRKVTQVRELTPLQENLELCKLPNGVFGYGITWGIDRLIEGRWGDNCGVTLQKNPGLNSNIEIHKSSNGTMYVFAYASESTLLSLKDPTRDKPIDIRLFDKPYKENRHLIGIPSSRIKNWFDRRIQNDITVFDATLC
ncbi:hypothetical protein [Synechococcus sp. Cu2B8-bc1011]|uniref:hypothetical protein n=1 Tax=Synechococcus sp. Cu2B8-bc1011 TaxID=3093725 RepID=UPI0039B0522C